MSSDTAGRSALSARSSFALLPPSFTGGSSAARLPSTRSSTAARLEVAKLSRKAKSAAGSAGHAYG